MTENIVDVVTIAGTGVASIGTGIYDIATGSKETEEMWKATMSFVAEEHVNNAFADFYKNNQIGKWLDEHAIDAFKSYGTGFQVTEGLSYTAGLVLLTLATGGIGGAVTGGGSATAAAIVNNPLTISALATAAGTGKYTQEYWANARDNANGKEWRTVDTALGGLAYGVANGIWEGVQYYTGAKIAGTSLLPKGTALQNAAARVGIDTIFNAFDTPARATTSLVADYLAYGKPINAENWRKAFEERGGWNSVAADVAIGAIGSSLGEVIDIGKSKTSVKETKFEEKTLKEFWNSEDVAEYFSDPKGYTAARIGKKQFANMDDEQLYEFVTQRSGLKKTADKFKNLVEQGKTSEARNLIEGVYGGNTIYRMSDSEIYDYASKTLSSKELKKFKELFDNRREFTQQEKELLEVFAKSGGPWIDAKLRDTDVVFNGTTLHGTDTKRMNDGLKRAFEKSGYDNIGIDDAIKILDNIIENSSPTTQPIKVTRYIDDLYKDGDRILVPEIGTVFNDKAFLSTSAVGGVFEDRKIRLEIEIPEGTKAAYIQPRSSRSRRNESVYTTRGITWKK